MRRAPILAAVLALGLASPGAARGDVALDRSKALVAAPAASPFVTSAALPAATARVVADELAAAIPLPAGGTFTGVRWEQAGGVFSRADIIGVLQYNAACQWLRAWRDGRDRDLPARVLADVPAWPAWRFGDGAPVFAALAADVRAGGGRTASALLAGCDASHEREITYAAARGLASSR
jgi:hypothetical protein